MSGSVRCPCCSKLTLGASGAHELCGVCLWQDDGQGDDDADEVRGGPNRSLSLTAARTNYRLSGACEPTMVGLARQPELGEI